MNKEEKARLCVVRPLSFGSYEVGSSSGKTYFVTTYDEGASARCSCPWGEIHGEASCENGCSHMKAVWLYEQGTLYEQKTLYEQDAVDDAGDAYWRAKRAGYSDEDAAAAADSVIGYFYD